MKKIVFNGSGLIGKEIYGVQRVTLEILKELDKIIEDGQAEVIIPSDGFCYEEFNHIKVKNLKLFSRITKIKKMLWDLFIFPFTAKKDGALTADFMLGLPIIPLDVVMIHDCIPELFLQNSVSVKNKISRFLYMFRVLINVHFCKQILTVSECSKKDIVKIYKINEKKIEVIPLGWQHFNDVDFDENVLDKYNLISGEYFFSLGSRYEHKNFKWIVDAAVNNENYKFVITGTNELSKSDAYLNHNAPKNLIFTGYLSDEEVKTLMKCCKAFIQPSLYEGFGIPPMEAMSVGAKCVISKTGSLPEIYEDSVWYIDPNDYTKNNLDDIMKKKIKPNSYILKKYDWKMTAEKIKEILLD